MEKITIGSRHVCQNAGFVRRLVLVSHQEVEYLPDPALLLGHTQTQLLPMGDIGFAADAQAHAFNFEYKSCQYALTENMTADGPLYLLSLQGNLPKLAESVTQALEKDRNRRWVAFFQDHNQNYYVAGTPDYPLTLTYSQSITDQNTSRVFLQGRTPQAPYNTDALPTNLYRYFSSGFERTFL